MVAVGAILGFLAIVAVSLRFWARRLKNQKRGIDDLLLIVALILTLGVVAVDIVAATWSHVGQHEILNTSGPHAGKPVLWEVQRESVAFQQAAAILNVLSDFVIIVMPIPVIFDLRMLLQQKIAITGLFLTSSLVIVAGIGRTVSYFNLIKDFDLTYHDYYLIIWTSVEPCMGVIGACLPCLRPIFHEYSGKPRVGSIRSIFSLRSMASRDPMHEEMGKVYSKPLRAASFDGDSAETLENSNSKATNGTQLQEHGAKQSRELERTNTTMEV
ncbi:MAG: hypothetical protein M1820_002167 [Bogoriella megaspora]|nr:MAG: hypothetical protein M1820_002167 [Bogoriella megaspora]